MSNEGGNIIWLASYPKSGNTWLRIFLHYLTNEDVKNKNLNSLWQTAAIDSERKSFDESLGLDSGDLTVKEINYYFPRFNNLKSIRLKESIFVKTHNSYAKNHFGEWILPPSSTKKALYIIRNPLDVCVSYKYHTGNKSFDYVIGRMNDKNLLIGASKTHQKNQIHQILGSWSEHVISWTEKAPVEVKVVRYEDMKLEPLKTFMEISSFLDIEGGRKDVENALEKCKIEKLQTIESEMGFVERPIKSSKFFRKGVIGSWRDDLTMKQAQILIDNNRDLMIRYKYLSEDGALLV